MKDSELEILKTELKLKTQQLEENLSLVEGTCTIYEFSHTTTVSNECTHSAEPSPQV